MSILLPAEIPWELTVLGNSLFEYVRAAGYLVGLLLLFKVLQSIILLRLKVLTERTHTDVDDTFISILQSLRPSFYFVLALYAAIRTLQLPGVALKVADAVLIIVLVAQTLIALQILLNYMVHKRTGQVNGQSAESAIRFLSTLAKFALWTVGILFILSNVGVNVTSLVAGLGISGIAIALAAQNVLTDLFSSLSIYFDRPFNVGDFIIVGDVRGTVQRIGIKTTRIQSVDGEEIIISNRELTAGRIKNYSRMDARRVRFDLAVKGETAPTALRAIPGLVEEVIRSVPQTRFDRVHLREITSAGFSFRVVFYMTVGGFAEYTNARQEVNFKIVEAFEKAEIELA